VGYGDCLPGAPPASGPRSKSALGVPTYIKMNTGNIGVSGEKQSLCPMPFSLGSINSTARPILLAKTAF